MSFWRNAGLTYVRYSNVCARVIRETLKNDIKADILKRNEETIIKATKYENGKPIAEDKSAS